MQTTLDPVGCQRRWIPRQKHARDDSSVARNDSSVARSGNAGFTFIEILVALMIGTLIMATLLELFLANQRALQSHIDLSTLIARTRRATDILRVAIHQAENKVQVVGDSQLILGDDTYLIDQYKLTMIRQHRKYHLINEVSEMKIVKSRTAVNIVLHIGAGRLGKTINVFTALT